MSTRLRVTVVGRVAEHQLIKVTLDADPATVRAELITKASAKLGVSVLDRERVRMFLAGGAVLDDVTMLEKDDTVYFAFAGGPWHAPRREESDSDSFVEQEFDDPEEEEAAWLERSRAIQRFMIARPAPSREECAAAMAAQSAALAASRSPAEKDATRRLVVDLMVQRAQGNNMDRHGEPACSNPSRSSSTHLGIDLTPCLTLSLVPASGNVIDAQDLAQNTTAFMAMMDDDFKEEVKARLAA